jgi:hypothetical protein
MTVPFEEVTALAAVAVCAAALVAGALTLVRTRRPGLALSVLLDLLLAAGLLWLSGDREWEALATVAAIVALWRLLGVGLPTGRRPRPPGWPRTRAGTLRSLSVDRLVRPAWRL